VAEELKSEDDGEAVTTVEELEAVQSLGGMMVLSDEPGFKKALRKPTEEFAYTFLMTSGRTGYYDSDAFEMVYTAAAKHMLEPNTQPPPHIALRVLDELGIKDRRIGAALAAAIVKRGTPDINEALQLLEKWDRVDLTELMKSKAEAAHKAEIAALNEPQPCFPYYKGQCKKGAECKFSHAGAKQVIVSFGGQVKIVR
jgi:hypothetical protein